MIKIPIDQIYTKIKEKAGLSDEEIAKKIDDKLAQLSGLVSKEGAAHIVANELGVKLFEQSSGRLKIKNILTGMRNVEALGKVQQLYEVREFQKGEGIGRVGSMILGDETGTIRVVCWGSHADMLNRINKDDILLIESAYVRENRGVKELHLNDRSKITINPKGETVGEVVETRPSFNRKQIKDLAENDENVELLGTIVQVFDPRFFEVCPECNKRLILREEKYYCPKHELVDPNYAYVMNLFLDDGTDNIRCVFFRNQMEKLVQKSSDQMLEYRTNPEKFDEIKTQLLGNIVKLVGRVKKNIFFDRIEFVVQLVFPNPDPEEEIKRLKETTNS